MPENNELRGTVELMRAEYEKMKKAVETEAKRVDANGSLVFRKEYLPQLSELPQNITPSQILEKTRHCLNNQHLHFVNLMEPHVNKMKQMIDVYNNEEESDQEQFDVEGITAFSKSAGAFIKEAEKRDEMLRESENAVSRVFDESVRKTVDHSTRRHETKANLKEQLSKMRELIDKTDEDPSKKPSHKS